MNNKIDQVPQEFKKLAEDFSKNGFITTSLDNLINWSRSGRKSSSNILKTKMKPG